MLVLLDRATAPCGRRRGREVQSRRPGPDARRNGRLWSSRFPAGWSSSTRPAASFPFLQKLAGTRPHRPDRDRFGRPAVRDGLPGILRQGVRRRRRRTPTRTAASRSGRRFSYASAAVRQWFEQNGRAADRAAAARRHRRGRRPRGRRRQASTAPLARITYLEPEPALGLPSDTELAGAAQTPRRARSALEELKARQGIDSRRSSTRPSSKRSCSELARARSLANHRRSRSSLISRLQSRITRLRPSSPAIAALPEHEDADHARRRSRDVRHERHAAAAGVLAVTAMAPALNSCIRNQKPSRTIAGSSMISQKMIERDRASARATAGRARSTRPSRRRWRRSRRSSAASTSGSIAIWPSAATMPHSR